MKRGFRILRFLVIGIAVLAGLAFAGYRIWRGPDAQTILSGLTKTPSPVLSPDAEREAFRLPDGFRIELVASEPLVVDPVALDWDDEGRLYVVEMRGFMGDLEGLGEDQPSGRIVVLEDLDHDGQMDQSHVFLANLVLPRAIAVLPEGVLIGVPPDLFLCRDRNENLHCEPGEKTRLGPYAAEPGNVEHHENALLPAIDGWIYNAKSDRRFRLQGETLEVEKTLFRGQWGLAQDDEGRLYSNHNSAFLFADTFPSQYLERQPATAARLQKPGLNQNLAADEMVFGVRTAAGLNRAYQQGTLRPDGRQKGPTAVSGLTIQRGDQYGETYQGDAFVPESGGSVIAHFALEQEGQSISASHRLYPDPDWKEREFLASTDERFRPVDIKVGPGGALWVIDMYRGVIQHTDYVSDHLRAYVQEQDLEAPGATGRIWRIVHEDRPIPYAPPSLKDVDARIAALDHPNAWARDRAQRGLCNDRLSAEHLSLLSDLASFSPIGRLHALWVLRCSDHLEIETGVRAAKDDDPRVRRIGLRVSESLLPRNADAFRRMALTAMEDPDPGVRLQAILSLGELPPALRPVSLLLDRARSANAVERQAIQSSLAGFELASLEASVLENPSPKNQWIRELATASFAAGLSAQADEAGLKALLDLLEAQHAGPASLLILEGIREGQDLPGLGRALLPARHPVFAGGHSSSFEQGIDAIRRGFTWPGDPNPGGAPALTEKEEAQRQQGANLFAATCATCHGASGRGRVDMAPPLAGSAWVRDADEWLVRIILDGIRGPIKVQREEWNGVMPGHRNDPRFDDETLAGLITHLRRSWGHADRAISPERVAAMRAATRDQKDAWTAESLLKLPVDHRLDRFTGTYRVPIVGLEMVVRREGSQLTLGRKEGGRAPLLEVSDSLFASDGMQLRFPGTETNEISEAELTFGDQTLTVSRSKD